MTRARTLVLAVAMLPVLHGTDVAQLHSKSEAYSRVLSQLRPRAAEPVHPASLLERNPMT